MIQNNECLEVPWHKYFHEVNDGYCFIQQDTIQRQRSEAELNVTFILFFFTEYENKLHELRMICNEPKDELDVFHGEFCKLYSTHNNFFEVTMRNHKFMIGITFVSYHVIFR